MWRCTSEVPGLECLKLGVEETGVGSGTRSEALLNV